MSVTMSIHEAKAKLSELVAVAERGETAYITRRNVPVAQLIPMPRRRPVDIYPMSLSDDAVRESLAPAFSDSELRDCGLA